jgi:hypothetical protein
MRDYSFSYAGKNKFIIFYMTPEIGGCRCLGKYKVSKKLARAIRQIHKVDEARKEKV